MYKGPFLRCVDHWRAAGTQPPPSVFVEKNRNVKNSGVSFCFKERNFIGIGTIILKRRRRFFLSRGVNCLEKRNQCGFFEKASLMPYSCPYPLGQGFLTFSVPSTTMT
uniref:Uncharacterized protein n=2 Tax=Cacopsylla melanoneura TaxID=428564 RepID=A0A8D8XFI8_9HEMI